MAVSIAHPCVTHVEGVKAMSKLKGRRDGENGRNEHYDIGTRKNVPRKEVVREIEQGKHPGTHVYKRDGQKYARDNPDNSPKDNVNR